MVHVDKKSLILPSEASSNRRFLDLVASNSVLSYCRSEERSTSCEGAVGTGVWGSGIRVEGGRPPQIGLLGGSIP